MENRGFDNGKYLQLQSAHIRKRLDAFGGKLYLEFGGKLYDDNHAARVLPGFEPDSKLQMLLQLKDQVEMIIAINAGDIEKNKIRGDLGITYDRDVLRLLDRWNLVPKALIEVSPFHCSGFITHMKSLGIPAVYHHIYDFGTVGQFIAMGKEEYKPVVNKRTKNLEVAKVMNIKIVADERICDGLYYAKSFRLFRRIMENPWLLDERLEEVKKDVE